MKTEDVEITESERVNASYKLGVNSERERIIQIIKENVPEQSEPSEHLMVAILGLDENKGEVVENMECKNTKDGVKCGEVYSEEGGIEHTYLCESHK